MKLKLQFIFLLLLSFSITASSQQEQQNSQYMFTKYRINPAYGGLDYSLSIDAMIRSQWTGLPGEPRTQYIGANVPAYILNGAVGGEIFRSTEGALSHLQINGSYNYVLNLPFGFLSLGSRLGIIQSSFDESRLRTSSGDYQNNNLDHNDLVLSNENLSNMVPTAEFGMYLYSQNYQVGSSISRIVPVNTEFNSASIKHVNHLDLYGEYTLRYNEEIRFLQSILLKSDFNIIQTDISTTIDINGSIFGGIGVRGYDSNSIDAFTITAGLRLGEHYRLTYSYDSGLSEVRRVNEGTHEILLNYNLRKIIGLASPPKVEYNPRFL